MAALIETDLQELFVEYEQEPDYIKEYQKIMANPRMFEGLDVSSASPDELGGYFARRFKNLYNYEFYEGHLYPRPGLLGARVVFSYQPYDKGSFTEGILHFVLPHSHMLHDK